ncbi:MAG TPA: hypothetical protein VH369_11680, partial [Bryobacteraceae bacterium]
MIELLNRGFVPVTSANEFFKGNGAAPAAEKAARSRILREFVRTKLGTGDVHVYIIAPDGSAVGGLDIGKALKTEIMISFLEATLAKLHTSQGPPVIKPRPRSVPPLVDSSSLAFHLVARGSRTGSWRQFPSENWLVMSESEWKQLLPENAALHASWEVPPAISGTLYQWFYPQTEDSTRVNRSQIEQQSMRMTIVTLRDGMARARIEGSLKMKHAFYPGRNTNETVNATVLGFMDFEVAARRIQRMRLVTNKATYVNES